MEPKEVRLSRSDVHDIPVEVLEEVLRDPVLMRIDDEVIKRLIQHLAPSDMPLSDLAVGAPANS